MRPSPAEVIAAAAILFLAAAPLASAAQPLPSPAPTTLRECSDACGAIPREVCQAKWLRVPECFAKVNSCFQACGIPDYEGSEPSACALDCDKIVDTCYTGEWTVEECTRRLFTCFSGCKTFVTVKFKTFEVRVGGGSLFDAENAVAKNAAGEIRRVAAKRLVLERRGEAEGQPFTLELPVELPSGEKLGSFEVPQTGFQWNASAREMRVPLKSGGSEIAQIRGRTGEAVGTGTSARIPVESLALETRPIEADFSKSAPSLGKVAAELKADLNGFPDNATLKLRGESVVGAEARDALAKRAAQEGLRLKEAPYALAAEKQGLDPSIKSAQVTMRVGEAWVKENGPGKVKIFRKNDAGQTEILDTKFQGYQGGQGVFTANASGFSVFSLVSVESAGTGQTPAPSPKQPGFETAAALAALGVALLLLRRR